MMDALGGAIPTRLLGLLRALLLLTLLGIMDALGGAMLTRLLPGAPNAGAHLLTAAAALATTEGAASGASNVFFDEAASRLLCRCVCVCGASLVWMGVAGESAHCSAITRSARVSAWLPHRPFPTLNSPELAYNCPLFSLDTLSPHECVAAASAFSHTPHGRHAPLLDGLLARLASVHPTQSTLPPGGLGMLACALRDAQHPPGAFARRVHPYVLVVCVLVVFAYDSTLCKLLAIEDWRS